MENTKVKDWVLDIGADLIGGILIALGIYNFACMRIFRLQDFRVLRLFYIIYLDFRLV